MLMANESQKTPSRPADPMSISSLMSNDDGPVHRHVSHSRRSSRASNGHVPGFKQERPPSPLPPPHMPAANPLHMIPKAPTPVNGDMALAAAVQPVPSRAWSRPREGSIDGHLANIEAAEDFTPTAKELALWKDEYAQRGIKRSHELNAAEAAKRKVETISMF